MSFPPANPLLDRFKREARLDPRGAAVPVTFRGRVLGALEPASYVPAAADLERISGWRNLHRERFFSEFDATPDSTRRWIEAIAERPDRILFFLVLERHGIAGHIGLTGIDEAAGTAETDAWLGDGDAHVPGFLMFGFAALVRWSFSFLHLGSLNARVFADNRPVLRAHELLGYEVVEQVGMVRREDANGVRWEEDDASRERTMARLTLQRERFDVHATKWI